MSLVLAGSHIAFHHQHFKMVDVLIPSIENIMHRLNLHAALRVPRNEVDKVNRKDEEQQ